MPVIKMTVNRTVSDPEKKRLSEGFKEAFLAAGEVIPAGNLLVTIDDEKWISFRGNEQDPSALIRIFPGVMTPAEDYSVIIKKMFETMEEVLPEVPASRIYMTISQIDYWGYDGRLL